MKTLIKNAWVLTMDDRFTEYRNGWVLTDGSRIAALGEGEPPQEADEIIDAGGGLLLPGFVNTHCHVSMVPFRSMGDDCPDRLRRFLFPLENEAMTPQLVYLGAMYGIAEMLLSGTTAFCDMYYFEDEVACVCCETGMRGVLGETVISQPTCDSPEPNGGLKLVEAMLEKYAGDERIKPIIAPHGTTTVEEAALRRCHELAVKYDTLVTLHVSEMDYEMTHFREMGTTPLGWLDSIGLVDEHLLAAHCIHLTDEDVSLLKDRNARVAHCIGSNTKAGKGIAPVKKMAQAGIPFGLGTDGPSSGNTLSMFDQMRLFAVCHKTANHERGLFPAKEIVAAATRGGAAALGLKDCGVLAPGMRADITVVSTESPAMFPVFNPYSALVYAANAADVKTVLCGGRTCVKDGRLTEIDLFAIRKELSQEMEPFRVSAEKYADMI